ncbi:MAG TPA: pyridoxal phosphate-dependent aminotransferase [Gemmatimonadaceae bacterium]|nr:pyridoxal phosphate-dependent aminotransferase [Gemmatimonadaceae bacterium]
MTRAYAPSANVATLRESATIAVSQRARALREAGRAVIDLGAGEPDFDTPAFIRDAGCRAIESGATRYTATAGILPLRETIAERASERDVGKVGPDEIVVSTGSKQALFNACFTLFGPGDEVLIPAPSWTSYFEMASLARATAVAVPGDPSNGLKVSPEHLRAAATPRTRGVMLNSPCNPTGSVYTATELSAILALAAERGWWVISDEIYRRIAYEREAPSILDVARSRERLIVIDGVAKAYAMTGWRIGWAIAPPAVAATMSALQSHVTSNANSAAQHAALAALSDTAQSDLAIAAMVERFRERRDAAVLELGMVEGLRWIDPAGAFYLFIGVSELYEGESDPGTRFAREVLEGHDVAIVPGAAFRVAEWVRLSYAAPLAEVVEGVRRVAAAWSERSSIGPPSGGLAKRSTGG